MATQIRNIPTTRTELDGTEWVPVQTAEGGPGSTAKSPVASLLSLKLIPIDHTSSEAIPSEDMDVPHTNRGATGEITLSLPPAVANRGLYFEKVEPHAVVFDPVSDQFRGGEDGKKLTLLSSTGFLWIDCLENGVWTITSGVGVFGVEE